MLANHFKKELPTTGEILLNEVEINDVDPTDRRLIFRFSAQSPSDLKGLSIREGVSYGATSTKHPTDVQIKTALTQSNADFITNLDTIVGNDLGAELVKDSDKGGLSKFTQSREYSGGENQRLGISRTIVDNTRVIVLDEPTSQLDKET